MKHTTKNPAPVVGNHYKWQGPKVTFYMGECTKVEGARVHFDNGPAMLDDGRYVLTEPAQAVKIPVYSQPQPEGQEVRA